MHGISDIKLWKQLDTMKFELCNDHLCIRTVERAETGGRVGKQVHNAVNEWGLEVQ